MNKTQVFALIAVLGLSFGLYSYIQKQKRFIETMDYEFENVKIRGTLATAVFEKETVNAVGGQLYVANSTALTGSGQISASFDTMSVVNVSGFVQGEILSLKKVTETGFTTEETNEVSLEARVLTAPSIKERLGDSIVPEV